MECATKLRAELKAIRFHDRLLDVEIDARDIRGGEKSWEWIKKGVPLRVEIGPRDVESGQVTVARRTAGPRDKSVIAQTEFLASVLTILDEIQASLVARALDFRAEHTRTIDTAADFDSFFTPERGNEASLHGGFALAHWAGNAEVERGLKERLKVTIRNIPEDIPSALEPGKCLFTGQASSRRVLFAKSY